MLANLPVTDDRVVANIILSLRAISEQNWNEFFETVSHLDRILREDPSGTYPMMDFKTRDLYRKEIEALSFATGREEKELAEITLDLARKNGAAGSTTTGIPQDFPEVEFSPDDSRAHVGEYLLGKSREELEKLIGYRPDLKTAFTRWSFRHASVIYIGSIIAISILGFMLLAFVTNLLVLLSAAPFLKWIICWINGINSVGSSPDQCRQPDQLDRDAENPPHILPKLHFKEEIPERFQTLVVIPALITGREEVDSLIRQLELHYLRNPEPGLFFGLLTDFRDADSETLPDDEDLLNYTAAAIVGLNEKYKHAPSVTSFSGGRPLFYLLHRKRLWNPSERKWMGWERKRGKLHELNLLLRRTKQSGDQLTFSQVTSIWGGSRRSKLSVSLSPWMRILCYRAGLRDAWLGRWPIH